MNILEILLKLRDDLKLWVTNNILALKEEIDNSKFSGDYNDLENKPVIPTADELLSDEQKAQISTAYDHSQELHAPADAQKNSDITKTEIEAKLTGAITSHTHNYAGSSSTGGAATSADKVNTNLIIKLNGGTTEGTNLFTFNGSTAKTINITPSAIGAASISDIPDPTETITNEIIDSAFSSVGL